MDHGESITKIFEFFDGQKKNVEKEKKSWEKEKKTTRKAKISGKEKICRKNSQKKESQKRRTKKKKKEVEILYRLSNRKTGRRCIKKNYASKQNATVFSEIERLVNELRNVWHGLNDRLTSLLLSRDVSGSGSPLFPSPTPLPPPSNEEIGSLSTSPSSHLDSRDMCAERINEYNEPGLPHT